MNLVQQQIEELEASIADWTKQRDALPKDSARAAQIDVGLQQLNTLLEMWQSVPGADGDEEAPPEPSPEEVEQAKRDAILQQVTEEYERRALVQQAKDQLDERIKRTMDGEQPTVEEVLAAVAAERAGDPLPPEKPEIEIPPPPIRHVEITDDLLAQERTVTDRLDA